MSNRNILFALIILVPILTLADEPSAFGAGNLHNENPYGLTSAEKIVLENKNSLRRISVKSNNQTNEVDSIKESVEGLKSIIDATSNKSELNRKNINKLTEVNVKESSASHEYEKRLLNMIKKNSQKISKIQKSIYEISKLLDVINKNYVKKRDFNNMVDDVDDLSSSYNKKKDFTLLPNQKVFKKAEKLYKTKQYTKSMEYFKHLVNKKYKPARSYFMIGEISFKKKQYLNAIAFYKKSSSLYSKASYQPELVLHTGMSFQKLKKYKKAKAFYYSVIKKFPNSQSANHAKKYNKQLP